MVCGLYSQSITVGEEYKYEVLFGPFKLGKASLKTEKIEVINNQEVYHFRFYVKTSKLGDRLYKIRDEINTWISTNNLSLIKQEKNIREKNFRRQSTTTITNNIATTNNKDYTLPGKVIDPYGLIMIMRDINIPENSSKKFYNLMKVGLGKLKSKILVIIRFVLLLENLMLTHIPQYIMANLH